MPMKDQIYKENKELQFVTNSYLCATTRAPLSTRFIKRTQSFNNLNKLGRRPLCVVTEEPEELQHSLQ